MTYFDMYFISIVSIVFSLVFYGVGYKKFAIFYAAVATYILLNNMYLQINLNADINDMAIETSHKAISEITKEW